MLSTKLSLAECEKLMAEDHGDLNLSRSKVTSLSTGLTVKGDLHLWGSKIKD